MLRGRKWEMGRLRVCRFRLNHAPRCAQAIAPQACTQAFSDPHASGRA